MHSVFRATSIVLAISVGLQIAAAQTPLGSAFNYQGRLRLNGSPVNTSGDFIFTLWDDPSAGTQIGSANSLTGQPLTYGLFTVQLDFGDSAFGGDKRWLEISVRTPAGVGSYTTLSPRQEITPAPYARYAVESGSGGGGGGGTLDDAYDFGTPGAGRTITADTGAVNIAGPDGLTVNGNVGIGTTAAGEKLDVVGGSIRTSGQFISLEATLAPFIVSSATLVSNLNADLLDGLDSSAFSLSSHTHAHSSLTGLLADDHTQYLLLAGRGGAQSVAGDVSVAGALSGGTVSGDGSGLTNLNASNLASGTLADGRLSGTYSSALSLSNASNSFTGDGAGLTNLNASNLASGTLPSGRLSGTYSSALTLSNASNSFTGNGSGLSSVNADLLDGLDATAFSLTGHTHAHSSLTGLTSGDDHTQYAKNAGRSGGQTLDGGTAASDSLTLDSTANATKGNVLINPTGGKVGIGTATPGANDTLTVSGTAIGVNASSTSAGSTGVIGSSSSTTGIGVNGQATNATASSGLSVGVLGDNAATNAATNYYGVRGNATGSSAGRGVGGFGGPGTGVYGNATTSGSGVLGDVGSSTAIGVLGQNTSASASNNAVGVRGTSSGGVGRAVYGSHTGTGAGAGIFGESSSNAALAGVFGQNTSTTNPGAVTFLDGVSGQSISNAGANAVTVGTLGVGNSRGVEGDSNTTAGIGVIGFGGTVGVQGQSAVTTGAGVFGSNTGTTGNSVGVQGQSSSSAGIGVVGVVAGTGAVAVRGSASSTGTSDFNIGVDAIANGGLATVVQSRSSGASAWGIDSSLSGATAQAVRGVVTSTAATTARYGIFGSAGTQANSFAGFFTGNVSISGSISKGSGTFKIDHPLDPENKFLYHSFVESPDMMNVYNGVVTTDANGFATIKMPSYFEALNKDFRYQLTVIDESSEDFVQVKVVRKINNNEFAIRTSKGQIEVSWQVTGVRQDPFANANRVVPEVIKQAHEKGRYLHPDAYGQPVEMGIYAPQENERGQRAAETTAEVAPLPDQVSQHSSVSATPETVDESVEAQELEATPVEGG